MTTTLTAHKLQGPDKGYDNTQIGPSAGFGDFTSVSTPRFAGHYPATPATQHPYRPFSTASSSAAADQRRLFNLTNSSVRTGALRNKNLQLPDDSEPTEGSSNTEALKLDTGNTLNRMLATDAQVMPYSGKHSSIKGKEKEIDQEDRPRPLSREKVSISNGTDNPYDSRSFAPHHRQGQDLNETWIDPERTNAKIAATPHPPGHFLVTPAPLHRKDQTSLPENRHHLTKGSAQMSSGQSSIPVSTSQLSKPKEGSNQEVEYFSSQASYNNYYNSSRPPQQRLPLRKGNELNATSLEDKTPRASSRSSKRTKETQNQPAPSSAIPLTPNPRPKSQSNDPSWTSPSFNGFDKPQKHLTSTPPREGSAIRTNLNFTNEIEGSRPKKRPHRDLNAFFVEGGASEKNKESGERVIGEGDVLGQLNLVRQRMSGKGGFEGLIDSSSFMSTNNDSPPEIQGNQHFTELNALARVSDKIGRKRDRLIEKLGRLDLKESDLTVMPEDEGLREGFFPENEDNKVRVRTWLASTLKTARRIIWLGILVALLAWLVINLISIRVFNSIETNRIDINPMISDPSTSSTRAITKFMIDWISGFKAFHSIRSGKFENFSSKAVDGEDYYDWLLSLKRLVYFCFFGDDSDGSISKGRLSNIFS
ncbi:expressed protein [Phakopsora pachyrhizi]|uniref:Expressed protein n=1 Tax=Phakopsora pachyrhizi TaxID=170000 RepID=A0AAV0BQ53_PHAPC|nr:expressed protein [Phakopsora pachyrhizi]